MLIDHKPSDNELREALRRNVCNRNKELRSILRIINHSKNDNAIIALDGEWGSGKTFLIKQLELLWEDGSLEIIGGISIPAEEYSSFRNSIIPFYYNAWENDFYSDPSQSLFVSLRKTLDEKKSIIEKAERKIVNSVKFKEFLSNSSRGLIDIDGSEIDIANTAKQIATMRNQIQDAIDKKIGLEDNKRLLFIIDDLDWCNPQFAVRLLEYIKNGLASDKVLFLIATNYRELGNIIRGYYGGYIDGYQYLDRIFDLKISVGNCDIDSYIRYKTDNSFDIYSALAVANYLQLSMREINRYINIISLYDSYLRSDYFVRDKQFHDICRYIFIPIFTGYKIHRYEKYIQLSSGNGFDIILSCLRNNAEMMAYSKRLLSASNTSTDTFEHALEEYYNKLFRKNSDDTIASSEFWDILNITSNSLDL